MKASARGLLEVVRFTIEGTRYCFLATVGEEGAPHLRTMQPFTTEDDLTIRFGTSRGSRKVREIRKNPGVVLGFLDSVEMAYVALYGPASLEEDVRLRRRYWRDEWEAFWSEGPESEDYVLVRFVPERIELMNLTREIAPEPYGLRPAVLVRGGGGAWEVEEWQPPGEERGERFR